MSDPIIRDLSDVHKFNQCRDWNYKFRVFVRPDGSVTHPQHMGHLDMPINGMYWRSMGYKYAIRVKPTDYIDESATRNEVLHVPV